MQYACANGLPLHALIVISGSDVVFLSFQSLFVHSSPLWSDKLVHNVAAASSGFDSQEMKSPAYWGVPFTKLCLRMRAKNATNQILLSYSASSLYSVIADGHYRNTSLGSDTWKSLVRGSHLRPNCTIKEGFNTGISPIEARIGVVSGKNKQCSETDSVVGFGTAFKISCGSVDFGRKIHSESAFGYILLQ